MHRNDKQNVLKRAVLTVAMSSAICMAPMAAHAAGMGKITVLSALGQPLRAELDVTASREELSSLAARVAPIEAFRQANVEYAGVFSSVKFVLDKRADGRPYFRIQTDRAVNEPFIDFLVELSWSSGRLVREYAFLLDPPEMMKGDAAAPAVSAPTAQTPAETTGQPTEAVTESPQVNRSSQVPGGGGQKPKLASEEAAVPSDAGKTREVKPGDTLGKIAAEASPSGVSLDQMLVALFNSNRDAFIGGNMNRLRAGKILNIPEAEKVAAVTTGEAHKIVVAQSAEFNTYRKNLAASAASQAPREQQAQQSSSGKISPKVEERMPSVSGQDKLQVSRNETQAKPGKGKLSEEDLVARDKALKEANTRIADLEKNLSDLKKLADLKSQAAADAQKAAQAAKSAPTPQAPVPVVPVAVETPAPTVPAVATTSQMPAASATAAAPATEEKPQPKPKKKFVPPPPEPEPSFIEENSLLVYGGGAAIAAILGFLGFRSWKRKRDAANSPGITVGDLAASSIFGAAAGESAAADAVAPTDFGHSTIEAVDTSKEGVDPIQEAEVYMAYGRDGQAEEILVDAMQKDPGNLAVYLKLLEIYAGRKTLPQFNEVAGNLHARTGGNGIEWEKAASLGRSLDPSNPLYASATLAELVPQGEAADAVAPSTEPSMAATMVMETPPAQEEAPAPAVTEEEQPSALDFDLDLALDAPATPADVPVAVAAETTPNDIDFDLDLGIEATPAAEVAESAPGGLDINFDMPAEEGKSIDFDIAASPVTEPAGDVVSEDVQVAETGDGPPALDFDFDLGETSPASLEPSSPPLDLSSISLDLGEPEPAVGGDDGSSAEVATKLELAQAYEEMGDREGARELLEEVLAEGSPAQQEAARAKLAQLG